MQRGFTVFVADLARLCALGPLAAAVATLEDLPCRCALVPRGSISPRAAGPTFVCITGKVCSRSSADSCSTVQLLERRCVGDVSGR
jgi:hypothetical protein